MKAVPLLTTVASVYILRGHVEAGWQSLSSPVDCRMFTWKPSPYFNVQCVPVA